MNVVWNNFDWMVVNSLLAFLGVVFCYLTLKAKNFPVKFLFFGLWVLFVPNTIYILTDAQHFPKQFNSAILVTKFLLVVQYLVLFLIGVVSFIYSLYPFEIALRKKMGKKDQGIIIVLILLFNFVIAFAIALGKYARTNSWEVISNPQRVLKDISHISDSSWTIWFVILFGLIVNFVYFFLRKKIPRAF